MFLHNLLDLSFPLTMLVLQCFDHLLSRIEILMQLIQFVRYGFLHLLYCLDILLIIHLQLSYSLIFTIQLNF